MRPLLAKAAKLYKLVFLAGFRLRRKRVEAAEEDLRPRISGAHKFDHKQDEDNFPFGRQSHLGRF